MSRVEASKELFFLADDIVMKTKIIKMHFLLIITIFIL